MWACDAFVSAAGELLLGAACPGCGTPHWGPCRVCAAELGRRVDVRGAAGERPWAASAEYDGVWRSCLVAYKERRALRLARPLGAALGWAAAGLVSDETPFALVPVPSTRAAILARGDDVTLRLAREASRVLGAAGLTVTVERALRHSRAVGDQSGLDLSGRERNLAGSMVARATGSVPVIVVDDIITTGATLREAVRAVLASGRPVWGAAVVAATRRRDGRGAHPAASVSTRAP